MPEIPVTVGINPLPPPLPAWQPVVTTTDWPQSAWQGRIVLAPKKVREIVFVTMDFMGRLATNDVIESVGVEITVHSGTDYQPAAMLHGQVFQHGTTLMQDVQGGVEGTIYRLSFFAYTSMGQILQLTGYLAVVPETIERRSVPEFVQWLNAAGDTVQWQNASQQTVYWSP